MEYFLKPKLRNGLESLFFSGCSITTYTISILTALKEEHKHLSWAKRIYFCPKIPQNFRFLGLSFIISHCSELDYTLESSMKLNGFAFWPMKWPFAKIKWRHFYHIGGLSLVVISLSNIFLKHIFRDQFQMAFQHRP